MPGLHIQPTGFLTINEMMQDVVSKMVSAGFELLYPADLTTLGASSGNHTKDILGNPKKEDTTRWCAVLKAGDNVNVNTATASGQPWIIKFEWDKSTQKDGIIDIIVGTPSQFNTTTGGHTYYTAKYMSAQKREIVAGDPEKTDKAFDYKEVLGLVGTTFRNNNAILSNPDIVVKGNTYSIADVTSSDSPIGGELTAYPLGESDVVTNYRSISSSNINEYQTIDPLTVSSSYATLLDTYGGSTSAKVAYQSDWDVTIKRRLEKDSYVNYKSNTYKATSLISDVTTLAIDVIENQTDIFNNGTPADIIDKKYWIGGDNPKLFKRSKASTTSTKPLNMPATYTNQNGGAYYNFRDIQLIKIAGIAGSWAVTIPDTVTRIDSSNATTYKIESFYDLDLSNPNVATQYDLTYIKDFPVDLETTTAEEALDLSEDTASLYNLTMVDPLAPVYFYDKVENRIYKILSAIDTITTAATKNAAFPSALTSSFVHGAYNLKYVGVYTDFLTAITLGSSYYDTLEEADSLGYSTKLSEGDFSFPAIRRNREQASKMFFNRQHIGLDEVAAYPVSYTLSVTNRGFVFSVHEETSDEVGNRNSWVVVQRPVDHVSGEVYSTGKAPVHCMYSIMSKLPNKPWLEEDMLRGTVDHGYTLRKTRKSGTKGVDLLESNNYTIYVPAPEAVQVRRFVVREADITAPYPTHTYVKNAFGVNMDYATGGFPFGVPADRHTPDYAAVINTKQQVAISEGNKYVITFPNGFNTSRYAYTHEVDMIAYTSADVISAGTEVEITAYGETRKYVALHANGPNNTGMRILVLKEGGGIEAPV